MRQRVPIPPLRLIASVFAFLLADASVPSLGSLTIRKILGRDDGTLLIFVF